MSGGKGKESELSTGHNPAYGLTGPHDKREKTETKGVYEIPDYIRPSQPPPPQEAVYEGVDISAMANCGPRGHLRPFGKFWRPLGGPDLPRVRTVTTRARDRWRARVPVAETGMVKCDPREQLQPLLCSDRSLRSAVSQYAAARAHMTFGPFAVSHSSFVG